MARLRFTRKVCEQLRFYVYLYVDPRDGQPFYVGKGCGNRAFSHLGRGADSQKRRRINELRKEGLEPRIEVLKYGLNEDESLLVEATVIDLLGIEKLDNEVRGHGARHGSRGEWRVIEQELGARDADIVHPVILINISRSYRPALSPMQLYDVTRSAWKVGKNRKRAAKAMYALAVNRGIIREVYTIAAWVPAGTTLNSRNGHSRNPDPIRSEFVGNIAPHQVRSKYVGKRVSLLGQQSQNPIRYVNCEGT